MGIIILHARKIFFILFLIGIVAIPFLTQTVSALTNPPESAFGVITDTDAGRREGGIEVSTLTKFLFTAVNWLSWFVSIVAVIMGLYAGFLFMTASGDAEQVKTASKTFLWAIVGVAVAIITFSIIVLTKSIIGA